MVERIEVGLKNIMNYLVGWRFSPHWRLSFGVGMLFSAWIYLEYRSLSRGANSLAVKALYRVLFLACCEIGLVDYAISLLSCTFFTNPWGCQCSQCCLFMDSVLSTVLLYLRFGEAKWRENRTQAHSVYNSTIQFYLPSFLVFLVQLS